MSKSISKSMSISKTESNPEIATESELQEWLDSIQPSPQSNQSNQNNIPNWNKIQFDFKRELYRKAIGAK